MAEQILAVIAFEEAGTAGEVRKALKQVERMEALSLEDAAVVVKDEEGKLHVHDETGRAVMLGAVGGGLVGLLLLGIFAPIGAIVAGAVGGALFGKALNLGVDKDFVKEVGAALPPGGSALFLVVEDAIPEVVYSALKPYKGTVLQTTLPPDAEEQLERVLRQEM
jgi:uncharacterized membrane protein